MVLQISLQLWLMNEKSLLELAKREREKEVEVDVEIKVRTITCKIIRCLFYLKYQCPENT